MAFSEPILANAEEVLLGVYGTPVLARMLTLAPMKTGYSPQESLCFFFNDTATTEIYTLSLHDALPICWVIAAEDGRSWLSASNSGHVGQLSNEAIKPGYLPVSDPGLRRQDGNRTRTGQARSTVPVPQARRRSRRTVPGRPQAARAAPGPRRPHRRYRRRGRRHPHSAHLHRQQMRDQPRRRPPLQGGTQRNPHLGVANLRATPRFLTRDCAGFLKISPISASQAPHRARQRMHQRFSE